MSKALLVLGFAIANLGLLTGCRPAEVPFIPVEISHVVPANGADISTGMPFNVTVAYMLSMREPGVGYKVAVGFNTDDGAMVGGANVTLTEMEGEVDLSFTFAASSYMSYPYELVARLYESHPSYEYTIETSSIKIYY
ncbi:MAG: hypothetical protein KKA67_00455 [Spirochaetes bacterium]|nr:hypothetical protein [Spirochaetota bacterium]MBU1079977.1 hypothetical protein [Spirochaetota bacterium]